MTHAEPATRAQADMWLAQKINPRVRNNVVACWDVSGPIDTAVLDEAHRIVLNECPDLRVTFREDPHGLMVTRHDSANLASRHFDLSASDASEKQAIDIVALVVRDPFDLGKDPLYRLGSVKLAGDRFMLFMVFHHIIIDGVGLLAYCHRVADVYSDRSAHEPVRLWPEGAPSTIAQQERTYLESSRYDGDLEFWRIYLAKHPTAPALRDITPAEGAGDLQHTTNLMAAVADAVGMTSIAIDLPGPDVENLERAASSLGMGVPTLLIGAAAVAFRRLSAWQEFTFAIAVANRRGRGRMAPGLAANAIPISVKVDAERPLAEIVKAIASELPSLYRHSSVPIAEICRRYFDPHQDRSPVGPVLSFIPVINKVTFAGSVGRLYGGCFANLDELMISFYDNGGDAGLSVSFDAPTDLYSRSQVRSIAIGLLATIRDLADTPGALVEAARTERPATTHLNRSAATSSAASPPKERPPYRAPRNKREELLSRIFAESLGIDKVGIDDDFFQLGGNSLLAISLVAKLRKELDTEVAIRDLFQSPTIASLAEREGDAAQASARPALRRMT